MGVNSLPKTVTRPTASRLRFEPKPFCACIGKCRYNWYSAGSLGWPFPMLKQKYIFQIKYIEAILSNSTRNCYGLKLPKCRLQFKKNKFIVSFIIIFGTLLFPIVATRRA